ncbi:unnamed protein product [Microthlaspi erraticum]|uniref:Reverse transcriptase Ty1/copia-type domain-containing protein n=1 Tax=Microthlaspi erraticum TaxID=1685480 RepID=A0A6D2JMJ3_9BRAS|nr:unnamed protein product [Microthlaspi erraticum]
MFDLESEEKFVSRDVVFVEDAFPFKEKQGRNLNLEADGIMDLFPDKDFVVDGTEHVDVVAKVSGEIVDITEASHTKPAENPAAKNTEADLEEKPTETGAEAETAGKSAENTISGSVTGRDNQPKMNRISDNQQAERNRNSDNQPEMHRSEKLGRGLRQKTTSVKLKDFVLNSIKTGAMSEFIDDVGTEPVLFRDAVIERVWREAMQNEIGALEKSQMWDLTELPPGKQAIRCKWVYKIKFLSNAKKWELHQMDVHNAFPHDDLDEEVYMKPPPGYRVNGSNLKNGSEIYVLVYVDDLIIGGNDSNGINRFKDYLSECFHMKDLGSLKFVLGIEVARRPEGIFLCQRKYTLDIISEAGLLGCKPVAFPMVQQHGFALSKSPLLANPEQYGRLVGRLIVVTRPNLTYAVHIFSQFMQKPQHDHWTALMRVVRCPLTRRSVSGWLMTLGNSPISWKTKKQDVVSRSSAEAEYRCMAMALCELKGLRQLLMEMGVKQDQPMSLYCDKQAAIYIAANPVFHEQTKHVEIDFHDVWDAVQDRLIATQKALGCREVENFETSWAFVIHMLQLGGGC